MLSTNSTVLIVLYVFNTGSRDSTMALWSVNEQESCQTLAEHTPIMDPVFYFSNQPTPSADCGERVRSLAYHRDNFVCSHYLLLISLGVYLAGGTLS